MESPPPQAAPEAPEDVTWLPSACADMGTWMVYGATCVVGRLLVETAARVGLKPIVAGTQERALVRLADDNGFKCRMFDMNDEHAANLGVSGVKCVLSCSGDADAIMRTCVRNGIHWLDVRGHVEVLLAGERGHEEALVKEVSLIAGVGYDVTASDCLVVHLHHSLPTATHCEVAFTNVSHSEWKNSLLAMSRSALQRVNGEMMEVAAFAHRKMLPFPSRGRDCSSVTRGDVVSAYASTGIGNIRTYAHVPQADSLSKLVEWPGVQRMADVVNRTLSYGSQLWRLASPKSTPVLNATPSASSTVVTTESSPSLHTPTTAIGESSTSSSTSSPTSSVPVEADNSTFPSATPSSPPHDIDVMSDNLTDCEASTEIWAQLWDENTGERVSCALSTLSPNSVSVRCALFMLTHVMQHRVGPGWHTPGSIVQPSRLLAQTKCMWLHPLQRHATGGEFKGVAARIRGKSQPSLPDRGLGEQGDVEAFTGNGVGARVMSMLRSGSVTRGRSRSQEASGSQGSPTTTTSPSVSSCAPLDHTLDETPAQQQQQQQQPPNYVKHPPVASPEVQHTPSTLTAPFRQRARSAGPRVAAFASALYSSVASAVAQGTAALIPSRAKEGVDDAPTDAVHGDEEGNVRPGEDPTLVPESK